MMFLLSDWGRDRYCIRVRVCVAREDALIASLAEGESTASAPAPAGQQMG